MKKKKASNNIRHINDYKKQPPSPVGFSRPPGASYGYSPREEYPSVEKATNKKSAKKTKKPSPKNMEKTEQLSKNPGRKLSSQRSKTLQRKTTNGRRGEALNRPKTAAVRDKNKANGRAVSRTPVLSQRKDKHRWISLLFMAILFLICGLVVGIIGRNAEISKIRLEIGRLEKEAAKEKNKVKELKMKLETSNRTDYIEDRARRELGMDYIKDDQVVYIDIE